MNVNPNVDSGLRTTLLLLVALVVVLGLRVRATWAVAEAPATVAETVDVASALTVDGDHLQSQRTMLDEGAATRRDPFRRDPVALVEMPDLPDEVPEEVRKMIGPALSALIYDHRDPTTQITVDGERSGWLRPGDTFRGWTVTAITPRTVTITKGGKEVILP